MYALHSFRDRPPEEERKLRAALLPCLIHGNDKVRSNFSMCGPRLEITEQDLEDLALKEDTPLDAVIAALCRMERPPMAALNLLVRGLFSEDYDVRESWAPAALLRLGQAAENAIFEVASDHRNAENARCAALRTYSEMAPLRPPIVHAMRSILSE